MAVLNETIDLPDGTAPSGVTVTAVLAGSNGDPLAAGYGSVAGTTIVGTVETTVASTGVWTLDLPRNDQITPAGTAWKISLSGGGASTTPRYVSLEAAGPFDIEDVLTEAPASIASAALTNHLDDTAGAHAATAITFTPTGAIAATTVQAAIAEVESDADARLDTLEAFDTLAAELPVSLEDLGNGTTEIRSRGVPRLIHSFVAGSAVVSTLDETTLLSATFDTAADELAVGDVLTFEAWGTLLNNTGDFRTTSYRLKGDGSAIVAASANLVPTASTTRTWRFVGTMLLQAANAVSSTGFLSIRGALASASDTVMQTVQDTTNTLDLTQPITWDITADHDVSNASLTTVLLGALLWHTKV